jgi:hypothetical protein
MAVMATTKKAALSIRISESVKKAIDRAAAKDRRSTSKLVEIILESWLEAHPAGGKSKAGE